MLNEVELALAFLLCLIAAVMVSFVLFFTFGSRLMPGFISIGALLTTQLFCAWYAIRNMCSKMINLFQTESER